MRAREREPNRERKRKLMVGTGKLPEKGGSTMTHRESGYGGVEIEMWNLRR